MFYEALSLAMAWICPAWETKHVVQLVRYGQDVTWQGFHRPS